MPCIWVFVLGEEAVSVVCSNWETAGTFPPWWKLDVVVIERDANMYVLCMLSCTVLRLFLEMFLSTVDTTVYS